MSLPAWMSWKTPPSLQGKEQTLQPGLQGSGDLVSVPRPFPIRDPSFPLSFRSESLHWHFLLYWMLFTNSPHIYLVHFSGPSNVIFLRECFSELLKLDVNTTPLELPEYLYLVAFIAVYCFNTVYIHSSIQQSSKCLNGKKCSVNSSHARLTWLFGPRYLSYNEGEDVISCLQYNVAVFLQSQLVN